MEGSIEDERLRSDAGEGGCMGEKATHARR
jgi:hypothetical protein